MEDCPYCHGDKDVAKIAQSMGFRPDITFARIRQLEIAINDFIVEHEGRRAIQPTWNDKHIEKFKELLTNK